MAQYMATVARLAAARGSAGDQKKPSPDGATLTLTLTLIPIPILTPTLTLTLTLCKAVTQSASLVLIAAVPCSVGSQQMPQSRVVPVPHKRLASFWRAWLVACLLPRNAEHCSVIPLADKKQAVPEAGGWATVWQPTVEEGKSSQAATEEGKPAPAATAPPDTATAAAAAPVPADFDEDVEWEDLDGVEGDGADAAEDDDMMWEDTG